MKIQSESEKETKMQKAMSWLLTYPQAKDLTKKEISKMAEGQGKVAEMMIAMEKHSKEGIHYHCYVKYEKRISWNARTNPKKWDIREYHPNVQVVKNRRKTIEYLTKEDTKPYVRGIDVKAVIQKKRSYADCLKMSNEELFDRFGPVQFLKAVGGINAYKLMEEGAKQTEECRGIWVQGPPGCGKSHLVETFWGEDQEKVYRKPQNKWWDGYCGQKIVILEDIDGPYLNHYLKIWADKWKASGEVKGAVVPLNHEWFVVTSNYSIREIVEMGAKNDITDFVLVEAIERRFKVITMRGEEDRESAKEELRDIITEGEEEEEITEPASKRSP